MGGRGQWKDWSGGGIEAAGQAEVGYTLVANKLFHNIPDKMLLVINTSNNGTLLGSNISQPQHSPHYPYVSSVYTLRVLYLLTL